MSRLLRAFDSVFVDPMFQKNDRGEAIYYPFGLLGGGYLAPEERLAGLRQTARALWFFTLASTLTVIMIVRTFGIFGAVGWLIYFGALALLIFTIVFLDARLAAGLKPSPDPRLSAGQRLRNARAARSSWSHWARLLIGALNLLLAASGIAFGVSDADLVAVALSALWLLVSAALALDGALGLIGQSKAEKVH